MTTREAAAAIWELAKHLDAEGYGQAANDLESAANALEYQADAEDEETFDWRDETTWR
jgi:hypothetical protein